MLRFTDTAMLCDIPNTAVCIHETFFAKPTRRRGGFRGRSPHGNHRLNVARAPSVQHVPRPLVAQPPVVPVGRPRGRGRGGVVRPVVPSPAISHENHSNQMRVGCVYPFVYHTGTQPDHARICTVRRTKNSHIFMRSGADADATPYRTYTHMHVAEIVDVLHGPPRPQTCGRRQDAVPGFII